MGRILIDLDNSKYCLVESFEEAVCWSGCILIIQGGGPMKLAGYGSSSDRFNGSSSWLLLLWCVDVVMEEEDVVGKLLADKLFLNLV
jgi:hypothetical protein